MEMKQICVPGISSGMGGGSGAGYKSVTWKDTDSLNNYVTPGLYRIHGVRSSSLTDAQLAAQAFPVNNKDNFDCWLFVNKTGTIESSGGNDWGMISQTITFANRVGGAGETDTTGFGGEQKVYTRTVKTVNNIPQTWDAWTNLQGNKYLDQIEESKLDTCIDNGMYSGVIVSGSNFKYNIFTLTTLNNYSVAKLTSSPRQVTQMLIVLPINTTGALVDASNGKMYMRTGLGDSVVWGAWAEVGSGGESITIDSELSSTSKNPVQNKVITEQIKAIAASGGASLASAVIFDDGESAEQKLGQFSVVDGALCVTYEE